MSSNISSKPAASYPVPYETVGQGLSGLGIQTGRQTSNGPSRLLADRALHNTDGLAQQPAPNPWTRPNMAGPIPSGPRPAALKIIDLTKPRPVQLPPRTQEQDDLISIAPPLASTGTRNATPTHAGVRRGFVEADFETAEVGAADAASTEKLPDYAPRAIRMPAFCEVHERELDSDSESDHPSSPQEIQAPVVGAVPPRRNNLQECKDMLRRATAKPRAGLRRAVYFLKNQG